MFDDILACLEETGHDGEKCSEEDPKMVESCKGIQVVQSPSVDKDLGCLEDLKELPSIPQK